jgi:hypothetical protein
MNDFSQDVYEAAALAVIGVLLGGLISVWVLPL